jgi:hypothetical protein
MQLGQIRKTDKYRELQEAEEPDTDWNFLIQIAFLIGFFQIDWSAD